MYTRTHRHGKWEKKRALDSLRYRSLPSFFSLSTLWAAIHPRQRLLFQPKSLSSTSSLTHTHTRTGYAACPPPRVPTGKPWKIVPLWSFSRATACQNLCVYYKPLYYYTVMQTPYVRFALFPSAAGFYYSIILLTTLCLMTAYLWSRWQSTLKTRPSPLDRLWKSDDDGLLNVTNRLRVWTVHHHE